MTKLRFALLSALALPLLGCGSEDDSAASNAGPSCFTACHPRETTLAWSALPTEGAPEARKLHAAVWTGREMLVWGGMLPMAGTAAGDGAAYDPNTNTWRPIATSGAPSARHSHKAVWTGSKMLVWGGFEKGGYAKLGGAYDPETDTWTTIPEPPIGGRTRHGMVWTGTELVVWGGLDANGALADGARYNLASGKWEVLPAGGPKGRASHAFVWSGSELLLWGGTDTFDWFADGHRLDLAAGAWGAPMPTAGGPSLRESTTGIWTGQSFLIWGGWNGGDYMPDGATYDPKADAWTAMKGDGPTGRASHVSIWTGDELFVWGGCTGDSCATMLDDGGRYTAQDGWTVIEPNVSFSGRIGATGVWTGRDVIVFGGSDVSFKPVGGGGRATL
jgi:N-acetylneuraminic acid mutarotase